MTQRKILNKNQVGILFSEKRNLNNSEIIKRFYNLLICLNNIGNRLTLENSYKILKDIYLFIYLCIYLSVSLNFVLLLN